MSSIIYHASSYAPVNDLWLISCYYNPDGYRTKMTNFVAFMESVENSGLHHLIVECSFGDQDFSFPKSKHFYRIKATDVLWQKERLLNMAVAQLPEKCKTVVWIDCDVLFENPDWAKETAALLEKASVVQPFKEAVRLPKGFRFDTGEGERYRSFAYIYKLDPGLAAAGEFELHGHTGFVWATHKSIIIRHGLYDVCLSGNADHLMAHSFAGCWDTGCIRRVIGSNKPYHDHYVQWSRDIYNSVGGRIEFVEGTLLHLWHGDVENRNYARHQRELESFGFDPTTDIVPDESGCWKWNHDSAEFKKWAREFFPSRKED
jgi:hypothetical protein